MILLSTYKKNIFKKIYCVMKQPFLKKSNCIYYSVKLLAKKKCKNTCTSQKRDILLQSLTQRTHTYKKPLHRFIPSLSFIINEFKLYILYILYKFLKQQLLLL